NEVKSLEDKVSSAYVKYQSIMKGGGEGGPSGGVSALPLLPVNDQFTLNKDEAWYTLSIETQVPLDMLLLQCNVPVDIQEIEKSTAVISYSPPDPKNGSYLLATLRCSMYTSRLEVKLMLTNQMTSAHVACKQCQVDLANCDRLVCHIPVNQSGDR
uniref:BBS7 GAE domain-containing protein n=1 Tax=Amphimedon queenslandica TaxID=400682 RepID=A0A1X7SYL7_AMPQE